MDSAGLRFTLASVGVSCASERREQRIARVESAVTDAAAALADLKSQAPLIDEITHENVLRALTSARQARVFSIALLGKDGRRAKGAACLEPIVPRQDTARVQEAHQFLIHAIMDGVEETLAPHKVVAATAIRTRMPAIRKNSFRRTLRTTSAAPTPRPAPD